MLIDCCSSSALLALPPAPSGALRHGTALSRSRSRGALVSSRGGECGAGILRGGDARGFAAMPPQVCDAVSVRRLGPMISSRDMCVRCVAAEKNDGNDGDRDGNGPMVAAENNSSEKKFLTLPTILTLCRVAAVPLLLAGTAIHFTLFFHPLFVVLGHSLIWTSHCGKP